MPGKVIEITRVGGYAAGAAFPSGVSLTARAGKLGKATHSSILIQASIIAVADDSTFGYSPPMEDPESRY
jgi:hypothetical protein